MSTDTLALLELCSVATGLRCIDVMVKKAPIAVLEANLVEPGHFLILYSGPLAAVEESHQAALSFVKEASRAKKPLDDVLLPMAHSELLKGIKGETHKKSADDYDCLGVIETKTIASALLSCDRVLKDSYVSLCGIRLQGGLGGRSYYIVHGAQHDVDEAIEIAQKHIGAQGIHSTQRIARPHEEMVLWLFRSYPFRV